MKIAVIILCFMLGWYSPSSSQVIPYTGGNGSGYDATTTVAGNCSQFLGGNADGAASGLTAQTVCPQFLGGPGDGHATDSSGCITILPIRLLSFYGEKETTRNILHWKTDEGFKVRTFEVEKSATGSGFTNTGTVSGSVNSNFNYLFIDSKPYPDINFYRLRIIEAGGDISFSNTIVLKSASRPFIKIYPNPGKGIASLYYYSGQLQHQQLLIYQADGKLVYSRIIALTAGNNVVPLDLQQLSNGVYLLKIGETGNTVKIMIQK